MTDFGGHQHSHSHSQGIANRARILWALGIIGLFLVVQVIGAFLSGSLALFADAGHMASDFVGLVIALVALSIALKPATQRHTFGFRRFEVLGALGNALILLGVSLTVGITAVGRLLVGASETEIESVPMLLVAVLGLLANVVALLVLRGGQKDSINLRGAYLEVLADTLGSVAVIIAAVIIMTTGFNAADSIASLLIALMILPRAITLLRDVAEVLTQRAPREADTNLIRKHILEQPGVLDVHDLHIWSITTGESVFTVHVVVEDDVFRSGKTGELLHTLSACLSDHFDVEHSTFQFEPSGHAEPDEVLHA